MRIALALAAVLAFAAAPAAQSLAEPAPAPAVEVNVLADDAPVLAPAVDLSGFVAPSAVALPDDIQEDARRDGSDVAYYGSMAVAVVGLAAFATLFF